eukprot:1160137-Pelagomonas_calceolata.AAC.13
MLGDRQGEHARSAFQLNQLQYQSAYFSMVGSQAWRRDWPHLRASAKDAWPTHVEGIREGGYTHSSMHILPLCWASKDLSEQRQVFMHA